MLLLYVGNIQRATEGVWEGTGAVGASYRSNNITGRKHRGGNVYSMHRVWYHNGLNTHYSLTKKRVFNTPGFVPYCIEDTLTNDIPSTCER